MNEADTDYTKHAKDAVAAFAKHANGVELDHFIKQRADGPYLVFEVAQPNERLFKLLRDAQNQITDDNPFKERATITKRKRTPNDRLCLPETHLLRKTLSESLTVDRDTFKDDFFARYIRSVFNFEEQICSNANFVIYGRRGSGKSSLLAFALHSLEKDRTPHAWLAMQTYSGRKDTFVAIDAVMDMLRQLEPFANESDELPSIRTSLLALSENNDSAAISGFKRILPRARRAIGSISTRHNGVSIFVDDIHVLSWEYQPEFLADLYSISRGNGVYLKISGIEQFTRLWSSESQRGMEVPHDTQIIKLDYNLTMPDKSRDHIVSILDAHASYCGLPGIKWLTGTGVLSRLVWVAAAVPRDALNLFSQAVTKASAQGQRRVSVTSINVAASEMAEQKLRDIQSDISGARGDIEETLDQVKMFCINDQRKNAFLVEIKNADPMFQQIQKLIALRLVHVLHEGITPHEAGRRFIALMLDYGFYVGLRAARSIDLFQREPKALLAKELRTLPIFRGDASKLATIAAP